MRFKLDENLSASLVRIVVDAGFDCTSVGEERLTGSHDEVIHSAVSREERILITLDLDFANPLRFFPPANGGTIVLRSSVPTFQAIARLLQNAMRHTSVESPLGAIWIVEEERVRIWRSWDE